MNESSEYGVCDGNFSFGKLNRTAFIVVDDARCFYKPDLSSAVSFSPPYGDKVEIVKDDGDWVLLKAFGKLGWSVRAHVENSRVAKRDNVLPPPPKFGSVSSLRNANSHSSYVEYGPRGGRFTRTKTGYRRYL